MIEILVAEDDEMIANLIKINLVKAGYLCTCAYNGKDAANLLDSKHFDLCLFDIMLPEIDGYELLEYAKSMDIRLFLLLQWELQIIRLRALEQEQTTILQSLLK